MFGRSRKNVVELPSDYSEAEVVAILDDINKEEYAADISNLIKFVTETPVELANWSQYGSDGGSTFHLYGSTSYLTMVFADKAVTLETRHVGMWNADSTRQYSTIVVYRRDASAQLDLFKDVEEFPRVGSIDCKDVSPSHFKALRDFMSGVVNSAYTELKRQAINDVLEIFE